MAAKILILLVSALLSSSSLAQTNIVRWTLIKCTSQTHGTLWASLGRIIGSDFPNGKHFFTEWTWVDNDLKSETKRYLDHRKALAETDVRARERSFALDFEGHTISMVLYPETQNSFVGNWAYRVDEDTTINDQAACTAY